MHPSIFQRARELTSERMSIENVSSKECGEHILMVRGTLPIHTITGLVVGAINIQYPFCDLLLLLLSHKSFVVPRGGVIYDESNNMRND